ncbi:uncharacterized protein Z519_03251 [Cladophialophora bantiana CBS 173.52]|uniref:Uncharacterized protein n=1 Tax=Cladophialophora bantiana (strain ATCC 10958 / CBS 173.52 / CDC B-1940 / NIH 8579) TaxID=1442370 RepID=A0A0D2IHI3_CLAB1|nr:uncharacterized protein Z519_03251 [Cladophialophora bantiana CBS 173.52]KIW96184.1 hypothetical protein Z519_03251 [Cladophialophora bantiana CBS 173.52]
MPLPLAEIAAAARIAYTIYDLGFSQYTSAQQEYLDFGKDISLLGDGLEAIVVSVEHVNRQGPPGTVENPQDLASFYTIVGDFTDTLKRCEKLIKKNSQFSRDKGFVRNVQWNSGLGKYVQYLGRRVSFHCSKINLILIPLKLKMYTDLRRDIAIVHEDIIFSLEQIIRKLEIDSNGLLLEVPDFLEQKFEVSATNSGSTIPFPIEKGIDALALHLGNSTQKFVLEPPLLVRPDTCQYINLMKSVWLVKQLQANPEFETRCLDVLWGAYFRQLLRKVIHECRRFYARESPLIAPNDQQILQEADDKFEIWVHFDEVDDFDDLTEPNGMETRIFRASLPEDSGRAQQISVLRINTSRIRLVRTLTRGTDRAIENYEIDSQRVLLLPFYSFPEASADAISLGWKAQASDHQSRALTFRRLDDLHRLQEAITNFGVVADETGVASVQIKESMIGPLKSIGAGGRAQIWVCRAQKRYEQPSKSPETDSASPRARQSSTLTGSSGWNGGGPGGWARSYATSVNGSTSIQQSGNKALIERPISAQLVLFTEGKKGLKCFVAIQIDECTRLSPENCHCNNPDRKCKKIVIKSNNHKTGVPVKIHETKPRHEDQWNLAVFGYPEHEDARKGGGSVELRKSKFAVVEFESEHAREEIMNVFEETCFLMRERVRIYHQDLVDSRNRNVAQ